MTGKQHTDRLHTENTRSDITQKKQRHKAHRKNARTGGIYIKKRRTYRIYARKDGTQKTGTHGIPHNSIPVIIPQRLTVY